MPTIAELQREAGLKAFSVRSLVERTLLDAQHKLKLTHEAEEARNASEGFVAALKREMSTFREALEEARQENAVLREREESVAAELSFHWSVNQTNEQLRFSQFQRHFKATLTRS